MIRTNDLVASLARNVRAVPSNVVPRRITLGLAGGGVVTMVLIISQLGLRPDLDAAMLGSPFWIKWAYTVSLAGFSILAVIHLARPESHSPRWLRWLAAPVTLLTVLAAIQLAATPAGEWTALWQGQSWRVCTIKVAALSLPIFAGLMLAFRALAPTRLTLTGTVAGLAAGACAATLYGLHCPEVSALFVLVWYSLGILAAAVMGALIGPRLLRW